MEDAVNLFAEETGEFLIEESDRDDEPPPPEQASCSGFAIQTQPKGCNCQCHNQSATRVQRFRHQQLKHKFKSRRDCLRAKALMAVR